MLTLTPVLFAQSAHVSEENWTGTYQWINPNPKKVQVSNCTVEVVKKGETYKGLSGPPAHSIYPYYIYISDLDSFYEGYRGRIVPGHDASVETPLQEGLIPFKEDDTPYKVSYRWNARKWNSTIFSPGSWEYTAAPEDFPNLFDAFHFRSVINTKVALFGTLETVSNWWFAEYEGEKYVKFSNTGPKIVQNNTYKNPAPNASLGEDNVTFALKQIARP